MLLEVCLARVSAITNLKDVDERGFEIVMHGALSPK